MIQLIFIGIIAGVASALLFLAPLSGGGLAFPLFIVTGLPIAIAGLGWGAYGAAIALAAGTALILAIFPSATPAVVFACLFAAPMVWLSYLARLWRDDNADSVREWYPLGRLLLHAALVVSAGIIAVGAYTGYDPAIVMEDATAAMLAFFEDAAAASGSPSPTPESIAPFVRMYVGMLPFTTGISVLAATILCLWLAARIARTSGRFERPAEPLWMISPENIVLAGFVIAALAAILLPQPLNNVSGVIAGAFACALALTGLAVLHALTLGMSGRGILLSLVYVLILVSGLPLILLLALGAAESFFNLRARKFRGAPPTT